MKKILIALCLVMLLVLTGCNNSVYTVNFKVEGEIVSTQQVKHGEDAVAPADPELEGATFKEWDKDFSNILNKTIVKDDLPDVICFNFDRFSENLVKENLSLKETAFVTE